VKPAVVSVQVKTDAEPVNRQMMRHNDFDNLPPELHEFFRRFGDDEGNNGEPSHPRSGMSLGSGFFVSDDGYVVTNNHVVEKGQSVTVITDDGTEYTAQGVGKDDKTDLALLKVDAPGKNFTYVKFSEGDVKV